MNESEILLNWGLNNLSPSIIIVGVLVFIIGKALKNVMNCLVLRFDKWYLRMEKSLDIKANKINNLESKYIEISMSMINQNKQLVEIMKSIQEIALNNNNYLKEIKNNLNLKINKGE